MQAQQHTPATWRQLGADAEYIAECQPTQEAREWWQRRADEMYGHEAEALAARPAWQGAGEVGDTLWLGRIQAELEFDAGSGMLTELDLEAAAEWLEPMWLNAYQATEMVGDVPMRFDRVGEALPEHDTLYEYEAARRVAGAVALLIYGGERREDDEDAEPVRPSGRPGYVLVGEPRPEGKGVRVLPEQPAAGERVRLLHDVDRYPHFIARAGSHGTVVESNADIFTVRMDEHLPGAEEWSNEIVWSVFDGDVPSRDVERI